jgi:hypothetical protein
MLFAGLSCAEVSGAKFNSIAVAKKTVVLLNTFIFTISSPLNVIGDNRLKLRRLTPLATLPQPAPTADCP